MSLPVCSASVQPPVELGASWDDSALTHSCSCTSVCTHTQVFPCTSVHSHTAVFPCTGVFPHTAMFPCTGVHSHTGVPTGVLPHTGVPMHRCSLTQCSHAQVCSHTQVFPCTGVHSHTGVPMHWCVLTHRCSQALVCTHTQVFPCTGVHSHTGVPRHWCALTHKCVYHIGSVPPNTRQMFLTGKKVPWSIVARSSPREGTRPLLSPGGE